MTIHILGCGPSGLAAAHAAVLAGEDIRIFSRPRKSHMYGAQYLHKEIYGVDCGQPTTIKYKMQGTPEQYRQKVYDVRWPGSVSPEYLKGEHQAWDIRRAYDWLWAQYGDVVEFDGMITPEWMQHHRHLRPMISSIPLQDLCFHNNICRFLSTEVWAAGEAPDRGIKFGHPYIIPDDTIICNGWYQPSWYRASRLFCHTTIEWPWREGPTAMMPACVVKPLGNNCQCWPDVRKVGRYGKWEKGVLVHHAYEETASWLASL